MFKFKLCRLRDRLKYTYILKARKTATGALQRKPGHVRRPTRTKAKNGLFVLSSTGPLLCTKLGAFSTPIPCTARDPLDEEMNSLLERTRKLLEMGNLKEAESILEKALVRSRRANSVWSNILLLLLGKIALKQGEHAKSEKLYMELAANLSGFLDSSPAVERLRLWTSIDLAQLYTETQNYKKAEEHFQFSLFTLEAMSVGERDYQWAVETLYYVLDGYSELLTLAGRYDDALLNRKKAHQLCLSLYGEKHVKLVRSLNEMGRIYTYQGKDDEAISCFGKAIDMCRKLQGVEPMELAALLVNSGRVHLRRGLLGKARDHCQQAFTISQKQGNKLGLEHAKDCLEGVKEAMK